MLLASYEHVLSHYGIDPVSDATYYRTLIKIDSKRERGIPVFDSLQHMIDKESSLKKAQDHYIRVILNKAYFMLVQNMVSGIISKNKQEDNVPSR